MRMTLKVTIEMTPAQVAEYCDLTGTDRSEMREDIRRYVANTLQCSPDLGVEAGCTEGITVR